MSRVVGVLKILARLVAGLACVGVVVVASRLVFWPLIEQVMPFAEETEAMIRRIWMMMLIVLTYWGFVRVTEARPVSELSFRPTSLLVWGVAGVGLIGLSIVSLYLTGFYSVEAYQGLTGLLGIATFILTAAILEEVCFRGIVFRIIEENTGTIIALVVQSIVFGLMHMANDGATLVTMFTVTLIGAFWAGVYIVTRNIWVVGVHHALWNFTIFASGVPLSGLEQFREFAIFEMTQSGPAWITGGDFGPEDSIFNIVIMIAATGAIFYWAWRNRKFVSRSGRQD